MSRDRKAGRRVLVRVFGAPALLAVVSGLGLVSALVGDGVWDAGSWLALGAPLAVIAWYAGGMGKAWKSDDNRRRARVS